ncbi:hypothetical protein Tco_1293902 [Tanacetum coccineum]
MEEEERGREGGDEREWGGGEAKAERLARGDREREEDCESRVSKGREKNGADGEGEMEEGRLRWEIGRLAGDEMKMRKIRRGVKQITIGGGEAEEIEDGDMGRREGREGGRRRRLEEEIDVERRWRREGGGGRGDGSEGGEMEEEERGKGGDGRSRERIGEREERSSISCWRKREMRRDCEDEERD